MKRKNTDLIECHPHGWLPWHVVCMHLFKDPTLKWVEIPQGNKQPSAFVCPDCDKDWNRMMDENDIEKIRPACIECIRDIRRVFDRKYKEEYESTRPWFNRKNRRRNRAQDRKDPRVLP